jgi:hypothetical protein
MRKVIGRVLIGGGLLFLLDGIVQLVFIQRDPMDRWTFLIVHVMFGIFGIGIGINTLREGSKGE